jgi:hypothetical protein
MQAKGRKKEKKRKVKKRKAYISGITKLVSG